MRKYLIAILCCFVLLVVGHTAHADPTPTPSPVPTLWPTPHPITPSQTSVYLYLRPSPTPLTLNVSDYAIDLHTDSGGLADQAINVYRAINKDHIVDFVGIALIALIVVVYLVRFVARSTKDM